MLIITLKTAILGAKLPTCWNLHCRASHVILMHHGSFDTPDRSVWLGIQTHNILLFIVCVHTKGWLGVCLFAVQV